jgi:A/G-specific adenine glycosylase
MTLAKTLLSWYRRNQRQLPWREGQDAYKIWVSEIMLQQTRVEAVKEYYERWMRRFPTLNDLAEAEEEEVISYWQGLGYYSRARNLLQGVKEARARYGGQVPDSEDELKTLPGIGEYTAGAILSIAYDKKMPAIDGNVLRVFSRLYAIDEDIGNAQTKHKIRRLVEQELPETGAGDFNQALMDLGAGVCIPRAPRCGICPLTEFCRAKQNGQVHSLPVKAKKKPAPIVTVVAGILTSGGQFLFRRRPAKGLLAGMWEFPACEVPQGENGPQSLQRFFAAEFDLEVAVMPERFQFRHIFSHRQWNISFHDCELSGQSRGSAKGSWMGRERWKDLSFAGPHRKVAELLLKDAALEAGAEEKHG